MEYKTKSNTKLKNVCLVRNMFSFQIEKIYNLTKFTLFCNMVNEAR